MIKNLLYFSILTTVVVASWIGFEIYNSRVTSTIAPDTSIIITPIPPTFDEATIIAIKSRRIIPADLTQQKATAAALPQVETTVQASPSALPEATITPIIAPLIGL